jgi:hypothetical protein
MSDVPSGVARLLGRALLPAMPVGRVVGFAASNFLPDAAFDQTTPSMSSPAGSRPPVDAGAARNLTDRPVTELDAAGPVGPRRPGQPGVESEPASIARPTERAALPIEIHERAGSGDVAVLEPAGSTPSAEGPDQRHDTTLRRPAASYEPVDEAPSRRRISGDADATVPPSTRRHRPAAPAAALDQLPARAAAAHAGSGPTQARSGEAAAHSTPSPPPPVVIGQIAVHVTNPEPPADPFAGCRALADGITAKRGGGW